MYQVIEKCGCAGTCHKMDHMETVLDFSEVEIKDGTNTTDVRPVVRVNFPIARFSNLIPFMIYYHWSSYCGAKQQINVGQCVGTCPGNETEMCLLRDKREPSRCLAGLYSKQHTCTPARFKVHEYRYLDVDRRWSRCNYPFIRGVIRLFSGLVVDRRERSFKLPSVPVSK